jgi:hypothetical protein
MLYSPVVEGSLSNPEIIVSGTVKLAWSFPRHHAATMPTPLQRVSRRIGSLGSTRVLHAVLTRFGIEVQPAAVSGAD